MIWTETMALLLTTVALLFEPLATALPLSRRDYPAAAQITGDISGHVHDPSVFRRSDGTYFLFTTNDKINIATAPSMDGPWKHQGSALPEGSIIDKPGSSDLWAPDVFQIDETYYMYYSVSAIGSQDSDIGVATSTSMDPGTWTDHGSIGIPQDKHYNLIDPNLFHQTPDSPFLMTFGSFWDQIFQVPMANPPLKINGTITNIERNTSTTYNEGSYQFWHPVNGVPYHYLFFSSGACCNAGDALAKPGDEYKVLVCRSISSTGGFVDQNGNDCLTGNGGTLVLGSHDDVYAPGGQGVFYDPDQQAIVLYYHYVKPSVGYGYDEFFFGWNKLDFSSGWPVVVP